jgi:murein DD-endopeptidase MepM/ murein hydrolase activator NlpD
MRRRPRAPQLAPVSLAGSASTDSASATSAAQEVDGDLSVETSPNAEAIEALGGESDEGFIHPVNARITSPYGERVHPVLHTRIMHDGVDFGAACGTDVRAAARRHRGRRRAQLGPPATA